MIVLISHFTANSTAAIEMPEWSNRGHGMGDEFAFYSINAILNQKWDVIYPSWTNDGEKKKKTIFILRLRCGIHSMGHLILSVVEIHSIHSLLLSLDSLLCFVLSLRHSCFRLVFGVPGFVHRYTRCNSTACCVRDVHVSAVIKQTTPSNFWISWNYLNGKSQPCAAARQLDNVFSLIVEHKIGRIENHRINTKQ